MATLADIRRNTVENMLNDAKILSGDLPMPDGVNRRDVEGTFGVNLASFKRMDPKDAAEALASALRPYWA